MSAAAVEDPRSTDPVERLLEDSWDARSSSVSMRERTVEALAALAFLCCAGPLAIHAFAVHDVDLLLAAVLVGMYAFVAGLVWGLLDGSLELGLERGLAMSALKMTLHGDLFRLDAADVVALLAREGREVGR